MIVFDETSKDRRALRKSMGWHVRGGVSFVTDSFPDRGARVSALCALTLRGMESWRFTWGRATCLSVVCRGHTLAYLRGERVEVHVNGVVIGHCSREAEHATLAPEVPPDLGVIGARNNKRLLTRGPRPLCVQRKD